MTATQAHPDARTPAGEPDGPTTAGIDPADLATFLRVVDALCELPHDHPHHAVARRATSGLFKAVKKQRRT